MNAEPTDSYFMAQALREAERGLYTCHPNPRVGCLLVKDGQEVGRGFHLKTGSGHAEANALASAGGQARGATAYVTLEPCSFQGRTPSCADSLIEAGVARVVCAMQDPHPKNSGQGLKKLAAAGIRIDGPVLEQSARALNPGHIRKFESGMPFVRLKLAMSLDGRTALANGVSRWITGAEARRDVQKLRARSGAIVTGVQTVIDDDPSLSVRPAELDAEFAELAGSVPRRIVIADSNGRTPADAVLTRNPQASIAVLKPGAADLPLPAMLAPADANDRVDLAWLLRELAAADCNEVLFECGATLAGSLISDRLVDEVIIYMAPLLMGQDAHSLLRLPRFDAMDEAIALDICDVRLIGGDVRVTARLI